ncbi:class I SAM-dependent methyltransferase [Maribellus maritimus]|uniref:class I SAM-dependent methyltransferase n=1 Tax=Maribellus maritimus TaxID=2870838 RepID=UPI001EEB8C4D|nr:class I SAM-dependent methyltransferase [Maribellus maritimus]MCG6188146.1 class I SAM-dependent methyltransferase [Maribellus maritimus]
MNECRICGNSTNNTELEIREMYYNLKEKFRYFKCDNCGCLQISEYPENIADYYPKIYSSFTKPVEKNNGWLLHSLRKSKLKYCLLDQFDIIGLLLSKIYKCGFERLLKYPKVKPNSKILDIGSGTGALIKRLINKGFENITGTDIFIDEDIIFDKRLRILKKDINEINETFDFVMMNHCLEHMPHQLDVLTKISRLLNKDNFLMIRIPIVDKFSWREYGLNWIAIDPPRHYYLHTEKSIKILADKSGFELEHIAYDSTEFQFIGSEQILSNIPLRSENSYYENQKKSVFTKRDVKNYKKMADKLNEQKDGDFGVFYLKKR